MSENEGKIRIGGHGSSPYGWNMTVENLTSNENEYLEGALTHGSHWVRADEGGRLLTHLVFKPFPDPVEDKLMHPHWRAPEAGEVKPTHEKDIHFEEMGAGSSPSYYISHLCGYGYSEEGYADQARKLESFGFIVMRSRRGKDGKYWENWLLLGNWAAKGRLKGEVERLDADATLTPELRIKGVRNFLCRNVQFGTLDMVVQRAAMVLD